MGGPPAVIQKAARAPGTSRSPTPVTDSAPTSPASAGSPAAGTPPSPDRQHPRRRGRAPHRRQLAHTATTDRDESLYERINPRHADGPQQYQLRGSPSRLAERQTTRISGHYYVPRRQRIVTQVRAPRHHRSKTSSVTSPIPNRSPYDERQPPDINFSLLARRVSPYSAITRFRDSPDNRMPHQSAGLSVFGSKRRLQRSRVARR